MNLRFLHLTALLCLSLIAGPLKADLVETFSGTGPFTASGGPAGFDNPGWFNLGNPGQFQNNVLGEKVFELSANGSLAALNRIVGTAAFSSSLEISNPAFLAGSAGTRFGVVDGINDSLFAFLSGSNSNMFAGISANVGGNASTEGLINLGSNVQRATLYLEYSPDLIHGGGVFEALVEVNESGQRQLIGAVDGVVYTADAASGRNLSLDVIGIGSAEFDRLTFASVPEPGSAAAALGLTCLGWFARRRNQKTADLRSPR